MQKSITLDWSQRAERIFQRVQWNIVGTPVEKYLLSRHCALPESDHIGFLPQSTGPDFPPLCARYPAMVGKITDIVTGVPISLHFTLLMLDGSGKAPVENPKRLLAGHRKKGGVIQLVAGEEITYGLGIAEGIETALSVMASGWRPVWACIDAGNLAEFPVRGASMALTIFADADAAGQKAAGVCAARWRAAGRECRIVTPTGVNDWNDAIKGDFS